VSILALGGWHIGSVKDKKEAVKIMHAALDGGMTFFDNAGTTTTARARSGWARPGGAGQAQAVLFDDEELRPRRQDGAAAPRRQPQALRTDAIDLMQFHEIN